MLLLFLWGNFTLYLPFLCGIFFCFFLLCLLGLLISLKRVLLTFVMLLFLLWFMFIMFLIFSIGFAMLWSVHLLFFCHIVCYYPQWSHPFFGTILGNRTIFLFLCLANEGLVLYYTRKNPQSLALSATTCKKIIVSLKVTMGAYRTTFL